MFRAEFAGVTRWAVLFMLLSLGLVACGSDQGTGQTEDQGTGQTEDESASSTGPGDGVPEELRIARLPGIGAAPLTILEQEGWLEEELPDTEIEWITLQSPSAMRDAIISGDVDISGSSPTGSFLIGWDAGIDWKVLTGLNEMDLRLMVLEEGFDELSDFGPDDRIAVPSPDSLQAAILRAAAQQELGDAHALDENLVAMGHPDGVQALLSGQVAAHFTSPPFQFTEEEEGARSIVNSFDIFGPHSFQGLVALTPFYEENSEAMQVVYENIGRAIELLNDSPEEAAGILSDYGDEDPVQLEEWLTRGDVEYTQQVRGVEEFADFLQEIGVIDSVPDSSREVFFSELNESS